jgi:hypothetical protein
MTPFLIHHYKDTATKWFSSHAQSRALGAEWDPKKGCVKTFDDNAESWMMTEDGFSSFDKAVGTTASEARPDPSNHQVAAGASDLIDDQDSVGTFDPHASVTARAATVDQAQLVTGAKANPLPHIIPAGTGSASNSVGSKSTRSLMTGSIFMRMSQMEGTLAKVDKLDQMVNLIASKLGIIGNPAPTQL